MYSRNYKPFSPRNGKVAYLLIVARISGCASQKEASLEDQVAHSLEIFRTIYDGPVEVITVSTKAKGEALDRPELEQIETHLRSREIDVFVLEDLGRLVRGEEAVRLLGIGKDHGVRTICPNDGVDTDHESWHEDALAACRDHVAHNAHTSRRLKHKSMNRFKLRGGCPGLPIFGYTVPEGAKTYEEWLTDSTQTPTIQRMLEMLLEDPNTEAVADWLNRQGVPVGPYCRRKEWYGKMVQRFVMNPILKGTPQRGRMTCVKIHETGRRVPRKNPDGPNYFHAPHLAHVTPELFDAVTSRLKEAHAHLGRKPGDGRDKFVGLKRINSVFPGKRALCFYCGRTLVWGGNGITSNMMCPGSREYLCWNSIGANGHLLASKILDVVEQKLAGLQGFEEQFQAIICTVREQRPNNLEAECQQLDAREADLKKQVENFYEAIGKFGAKEMLKEKVEALEQELSRVAVERSDLKRRQKSAAKLPKTLADVIGRFREAADRLGKGSYLFSEYLRKLVPEIHVYLVRLFDHPLPLPRARVVIDLLGDYPAAKEMPELQTLSREVFTFDLFELPIRERVRAQAVELAAQGLTLEKIASRLPVKTSERTISLALKLHQLMREKGVENPLAALREAPTDYTKLRRLLRDKYRFTPLEGYVPPVIQ